MGLDIRASEFQPDPRCPTPKYVYGGNIEIMEKKMETTI